MAPLVVAFAPCTAPAKLAFVRLAPVRLVRKRVPELRLAPVRSAPLRLAFVRLAPVRIEWVKAALLSLPLAKFEAGRLAPVRLASVKSAWIKFVDRPEDRLRSARSRNEL